jgi:hypothetical protein
MKSTNDQETTLNLPDVELMGALPLTAQLWPPLRLQAYLEVSQSLALPLYD